MVEGNGEVAGRLILGCRELSRKRPLAQEFGGYLRSKKDGSFTRTLEVQNLPVSHDTASDSHNLIGDA